MSYLSPDFAPYLDTPRLEECEACQHTVLGLRPDNTIGYRNQAWSRFAEENGAPELRDWAGAAVIDVLDPNVRPFYEQLFDAVRTTGEPLDHSYQCSSPDVYREFALRVHPLADGRLLLIHHLTVAHPHRPEPRLHLKAYLDDSQLATQCCHCRRTQRVSEPATWDWVPEFLDPRLQNVSHGLCMHCFMHYYPEPKPKDGD